MNLTHCLTWVNALAYERAKRRSLNADADSAICRLLFLLLVPAASLYMWTSAEKATES